VVTNAVASKILFDGRKAKAVEFQSDGKTYTVTVTKEVILAAGKTMLYSLAVYAFLKQCGAGSFKTPQILELSGIGNKTLLESFGIPVVLDLPEIGENLQDHPVTLSDFRLKPGVTTLGMIVILTLGPKV
jgi:choline dehydrogenase-like flavoprotein